MTTNYKFNKKQVAVIIGVNPKTLSRWNDEKIAEELLKNCYKVCEVKKEGRSIFYYCKYEEYSMNNDEYLKREFNVEDINNFKDYTKRKIKSIESEDFATRKEICKETKTAHTTSKNYDKKLIDKGVFEKLDDILYVCVEKATGNKILVDKQTYNEFWYRNHIMGKELKSLSSRYNNGELSLNDYEYLRETLIANDKSEYMYYAVSKMVIKYDNYLYKILMESYNSSSFLRLIGNPPCPLHKHNRSQTRLPIII